MNTDPPVGARGDDDDTKRERRGIQSIEVGGRLLVALVEEGGPMSLRDLARKAGMPSAKAHPYLVSFGVLGLIQQDPLSGRYELGAFALQMGLIGLQLLDPVKIAIPELASLSDAIGHTVALAVLGNNGPTIVYTSESHGAVHVTLRTGTVVSILNTATGRIFSAWLPAEAIDRWYERELRADADAIGNSQTISRPELEQLLDEVRQHGIARSLAELTVGVHALSAPVFDHAGRIVLAVTAVGPAGTLNADWDGRPAQILKQFAANLSARLGHRSG
jgi:DNA-binding IclR family transcriptional regulator